MEEFNFILILVLMILVFCIHLKLNHIQKILTGLKNDKKSEDTKKKISEIPIVTIEEKLPELCKCKKLENETWRKFRNWFCYGTFRENVSPEYAAATTWLIRAGIIILLCAVGFFLKYSIENNLVSPTVRIIMTFIAAMAMFGVGLAGLNKKFHILAIGVLSVGIVTFYMGAFAGFKLYHILPAPAAFVLMLFTTCVSMLTAVKFNLLPIALISCAGGYLTPVMLSDNSGNLLFLLGYTALISAGVLIGAKKRCWRSLEWTAFVLSYFIIDGGFANLTNKTDIYCVGLITVNFLVFSIIPLLRSREFEYGLTEWLLPVGACALTLLTGIAMLGFCLDKSIADMASAGFAVLLSALTLGEGIFLIRKRRNGVKLMPAFLAASTVSLSAALPLALKNPGAVTSAWSVLAFVLVFAYCRSKFKTLLILSFIVFFGALCMIMASFDYVFAGDICSRFFRGGMFALALIGAGFVLHRNNIDKTGIYAKKIFFTVGGFAMLIYTSVEVYRNLEKYDTLYEFRHGGLSIWWAVAAVALLVAGIRKNYKVLRGASMLLFIGCLIKVYMVDIAGLNTLYKVIAFLLIGILFLGGAAVYIICRKYFAEGKK